MSASEGSIHERRSPCLRVIITVYTRAGGHGDCEHRVTVSVIEWYPRAMVTVSAIEGSFLFLVMVSAIEGSCYLRAKGHSVRERRVTVSTSDKYGVHTSERRATHVTVSASEGSSLFEIVSADMYQPASE